jgi:long-chain acyl-CoA synthetase
VNGGRRAAGVPFWVGDPGAVCAVEGERTLTWGDWGAQADRFADGLAQLGVGRGDRVAVRLRTRLEWLVISLGLAKLRAVLVAVNYRLAAPETAVILADCGVRAAVLDDDRPAELLRSWERFELSGVVGLNGAAEVPGVLGYPELLARREVPERPVRNLARMVLYSSGTTGTPRGAPLGEYVTPTDPGDMVDHLRSIGFDGAATGPGNRTLVNLPMHHGIGPAVTRASLASGGMVIFQRPFDAERALALIDQHRITHWSTVPTMLRRILALPADVRSRYDLGSIRYLSTGAAPAGAELKSAVIGVFGPGCLYESYGCTEAGLIAGASPADHRLRPGSCGRPFRQVKVRVVDDNGIPLPAGEAGEIIVRTPTVIYGYIGRGPLGPDELDSDGFYHTGDVGHLDAEGYLFVYDRRSDLIVTGGANVYPAEIEAVLSGHPAVALSAVLGAPDPDLGEQPIAVIETEPGESVTADELLALCNGRLARYKWPRRFHFVERIPVNQLGKIVKPELRRMLRDGQRAART